MFFNKYRLEDITDKIGDGIHGTPEYDDNGDFYFVNGNNLVHGDIVFKNDTKRINEEQYLKNKRDLNKNTLLVSINGTLGNVAKYNNEKIILGKSACYINVKDKYNVDYVYFVFESPKFKKYLQYGANGTTIKNVPLSAIRNYEISIPSKENQDKIVKILKSIEDKIKLNNKINNNLSDQIRSIYKEIFIQYDDYKRLDEISNVTIGKTPPRSEHECFTTDKKDIKWISIGDLGKSGMFIFDTSEKLTKEAVEKYNVRVIPKDTVILSFKLTVGRTAFTTEDMATNEAIAHFNLNNKELNNYLYCYLTYFNYSDLGSTSSIATAINSKIVKSIMIGIPSEEQLNRFNKLTSSMFELIKSNEKENIKLSQLRDTLLPKLMNGEIDLDNIEI